MSIETRLIIALVLFFVSACAAALFWLLWQLAKMDKEMVEEILGYVRQRADRYFEQNGKTLIKLEELRAAVRQHRDERGDDRCHADDGRLYAALPEGDTRPPHETAVTIENCQKFIDARQAGREYVSPQRRIEELEDRIESLCMALQFVAGNEPNWGRGETYQCALERSQRFAREAVEAHVSLGESPPAADFGPCPTRLLAERDAALAEVERLKGMLGGAYDRIAKQSDALSQKAEKPHGFMLQRP